LNAVLAGRFGGCEVVGSLPRGAALLVVFLLASSQAVADTWGGSLALSSDYFVRGISRTSNNPALQLDLHYASAGGFLAGAFVSNTQIDPSAPKDAELSGFIGFAWSMSADWRSKILLAHYAYPWNQAGANYNYDELDVDATYQGWLHIGLDYSPNSPRFLRTPYRDFVSVTEKSAEASVQRQLVGKLSGTAGIGYSFLDGTNSGGYTYWSIGGAYDFRSVSFAVSYVDTSAEAKALFYNAAASGRWMATAIWRF
jgi:uncharacterized protein (TIGR02001 family)